MVTVPLSLWLPVEHCEFLEVGDWPGPGKQPMNSEIA
jgi:hypothetical protein